MKKLALLLLAAAVLFSFSFKKKKNNTIGISKIVSHPALDAVEKGIQDELADLGLTHDGFRMVGRQVRELARMLTGGRSIDLLLSGYNLTILPSAWSALISGLLDLDVDLSIPQEESAPPEEYGLAQAKDMLRQLKKHLKRFWRCMG